MVTNLLHNSSGDSTTSLLIPSLRLIPLGDPHFLDPNSFQTTKIIIKVYSTASLTCFSGERLQLQFSINGLLPLIHVLGLYFVGLSGKTVLKKYIYIYIYIYRGNEIAKRTNSAWQTLSFFLFLWVTIKWAIYLWFSFSLHYKNAKWT